MNREVSEDIERCKDEMRTGQIESFTVRREEGCIVIERASRIKRKIIAVKRLKQ